MVAAMPQVSGDGPMAAAMPPVRAPQIDGGSDAPDQRAPAEKAGSSYPMWVVKAIVPLDRAFRSTKPPWLRLG